MLRRTLAVALCALLAGAVFAKPEMSDVARGEIDGLLNRVEASGCEFTRNGSRMDAKEFGAHLRKKYKYYDYLGLSEPLRTTEDFIRLVGSGSSQSGNPYQVRCAGGPSMPNAEWLKLRLGELRQAAHAPAGKTP